MKKLIILIITLGLSSYLNAQTFSKETIVISTSFGDMKIRLYNETPKHRDNFLKLASRGFYDSLIFHRVINQFMIQGGDPDSRTANDTALLGNGDVDYWVPAEFNQKLYHKKGALAAAREGDDINPEKESSGSQFYIVMGRTFDSATLKRTEIRINKALVQKINSNLAASGKSRELQQYYQRLSREEKNDSLKIVTQRLTDPLSILRYEASPRFMFTPAQKEVYKTIGGTPHLDMNYTVFGQVIEGLEVIDKIAAVQKDKNDRPKQNIRMTIRVIK